MSDQEYQNEKTKVFLLAAVSVVIMLWLFGALALRLFFGDDSGTIGDTFGAINALFTGLALIGVFVAIYYQRKELKETRKEFREQTKIHDAHLDMLIEQNEERKELFQLEHAPALILRPEAVETYQFRAKLYNAGAPIYDLALVAYHGPEGVRGCRLSSDVVLGRNSSINIAWSITNAPSGVYGLTLGYTNLLRNEDSISLAIEKS